MSASRERSGPLLLDHVPVIGAIGTRGFRACLDDVRAGAAVLVLAVGFKLDDPTVGLERSP